MFMHFTSQMILLSVGFGFGYGLLLLANRQNDNLKSVGTVLGWILIVMAIILAIFNSYFTMKISRRMYMHPCPMHRMMNHHGNPMMDSDDEDERPEKQNVKIIKKSEPQKVQGVQKNKNKSFQKGTDEVDKNDVDDASDENQDYKNDTEED